MDCESAIEQEQLRPECGVAFCHARGVAPTAAALQQSRMLMVQRLEAKSEAVRQETEQGELVVVPLRLHHNGCGAQRANQPIHLLQGCGIGAGSRCQHPLSAFEQVGTRCLQPAAFRTCDRMTAHKSLGVRQKRLRPRQHWRLDTCHIGQHRVGLQMWRQLVKTSMERVGRSRQHNQLGIGTRSKAWTD